MWKKALAALVIVAVWPVVWAIGKLDAIVLEGPDLYEDDDWEPDSQPCEPDDDE
jgi:hypothetical protein